MRKQKIQQEQIKRAIRRAMDYPLVIDPRETNVWTIEELQRYNTIIEFRQTIGSYLK